MDGQDETTGEAIRTLDQCVMMIHALVWDLGKPHPEWSGLDIALLPPASMAKLDDQVQEQIR